MKKITTLIAAAAVFGLTGAASAEKAKGISNGKGVQSQKMVTANPNAKSQGNCVGVYSSRVRHNGLVVREQAQSGDRSRLVQGYRKQTTC